MKHLGCTKCIIIDQVKNYVSLSLIHKLQKGTTYYEEFDFIAYNKNNNQYAKSKIMELNKYVNELQNIEWSKYNIQNEKWNLFFNSYSKFYPSPVLAFSQFTSEKCGLFYNIYYFFFINPNNHYMIY